MFENFNIFENNIISVELAQGTTKVYYSSNESKLNILALG
jgi:hypothetical protein